MCYEMGFKTKEEKKGHEVMHTAINHRHEVSNEEEGMEYQGQTAQSW